MKQLGLIIFLLCFLSCSHKDEKQNLSFKPKTTRATGHLIPKDTVLTAVSVTAGAPITSTVKAPDKRIASRNQYSADHLKKVLAGTPNIFRPGTDSFTLPKSLYLQCQSVTAGLPKTTHAKPASYKDVNPFNFSFFKTLHGLKNNTIRCMIRDKKGNLWLGSNGGGVACYDGKSFSHFTEKEGLGNNFIVSILEDRDGQLWFGSSEGNVSRYDGKTFTNFTTRTGSGSSFVYSIVQDKAGNIWFGTFGEGLLCLDASVVTKQNKEFKFIQFANKDGSPINSIYCMKQCRNGDMWFGSNGGGAFKYNGKTLVQFTEAQGLSGNLIISMIEDKKGWMWFGTHGGGVSCYDGKHFTHFSKNDGLGSDAIRSVVEDQYGNIWFGTFGGGLTRYNGKTLTHYGEQEGLTNDFIYCMLEDKSGGLWLGTYAGGLIYYGGNSFVHFTESEGLSKSVIQSLLQDSKGSLWLGTNGAGITRYNGNTFEHYDIAQGLDAGMILSMAEDKKGNVWFGSSGQGATCYDGKTFKRYTEQQGLASDVIIAMLQDKKNNLWFSTYGGGVSRFDGKTFTTFTEKQGLASNYQLSILEDKNGNIWFGSDGSGVSKYDGRTFTNYNDKSGLSNNFISTLLLDDAGNIWIGSDGGGISIFNGQQFMHLGEKEGLSSSSVQSLLKDSKGNIWAGTRNGLSKINKRNVVILQDLLNGSEHQYDKIKDAVFYNYSQYDGFLGLYCLRNSVVQDKNGLIWWGTDMLSCYNPNNGLVDTLPPTIVLSGIKLFGEEIVWKNLNTSEEHKKDNQGLKTNELDTILGNGIVINGVTYDSLSRWQNLPMNLSLPYNVNNLSFSFEGVHLQSRYHMKYQHKLEGLDKFWSTVNDKSEVDYGNLPGGNYILKIKAMNQSGVWSPALEFAFEVRLPWWQALWFKISALILVMSAMLVLFRWRTYKLRKEKAKLEKIVKERTNEVRKEKRIIERQKQIIEEKHKEIKDSINYAERIQRALLASNSLLSENLKDHFILFRPRDVVSGDFYQAVKLSNNQFAVIAADSTGHGVPGAIMSILNISCLDKAITKGVLSPDLILAETRKYVIDSLKNDGSEEGGKDGMDACILCFDFKNNVVHCAAANNSIWIARNKELIQIKADRFPVGRHIKDQTPFTPNSVDLMPGDMIYLFTDGFPDQFGGPLGKKFKYSQFQKVLISISNLPANKQKETLTSIFKNWKGDLEQIDDVTIIGIRV